MFIAVVISIFAISFLLALGSARKVGEKPSIKDVKKSLDKHRVIYRGHSSE